MELHPLLIASNNIPDWMAVAFFAFWAGLPGLLRWLLNVQLVLDQPEAPKQGV
jgi:hypothetical protein